MTLLSRLSQKGRLFRLFNNYKSNRQTRWRWPDATRSHSVTITAVPDNVLVDDRFAVHVQGLNHSDDVTIQANICDGDDVLFTSTGCFRADENGGVDVTKQESLAGNYTGVDAMGLMWSMEQTPGKRPGLRPGKKDVSTPEAVRLTVFNGHHTSEDITQKTPQPLSTTLVQRWYKAKEVEMTDVSHGCVRGRLFVPPGPGPFPGVIDMYGTAGGLLDTRAAMLASRGFVTLALAFFGYKDLPKTFWDLDLKYFKEAVEFLNTHPSVIPDSVGLLGLSKGGELAQLIALHCPQVRAVVSINGVPCLSIASIRNGCEILEPDAPMDTSELIFTDEEYVIFKNCVVPKENATFFPLWQRDLQFLNICGSDDQMTNYQLQEQQYEVFPDVHKDNMELVVYEGAGHLIEPPYTPVTKLAYHKFFRMTFIIGGFREQHARSQEDAWRRIQTFFRIHLTPYCVPKRRKDQDIVAPRSLEINYNDDKDFGESDRPSSAGTIDMAGNIVLSVFPREVLVDERFTVSVTGLGLHQRVTIRSVVEEGGMVFSACGCYVSDSNGRIDVSLQSSVSGTYTGVDQMGLVWSMRQIPGQRPGLRLNKKEVTTEQVIKFEVFSEHRTFEHLHEIPVLPLSTTEVLRWYKSKDVKRIPVEVGNIRGMLFIPPGPGPFPGVMDLFGSAGGLIEFRASLLASNGFVVLALAFFGYKDLPESFTDFNSIDYVKDGVQYLNDHPSVLTGGVGIIGVSKGAEIAQLVALHCPQVKAVVSINGIPYVTVLPYSHGDDMIPVVNSFDYSGTDYTDEGLVMKYAYIIDNAGMFELWNTDVKLLNICSGDDCTVPSELQQLQYDTYPEDKKQNIELVVYHGAGHLIEPPYSPLCRSSYHKAMGTNIVWGGNFRDHAYAQEDSWKRIKDFFGNNLPKHSSDVRLSSRL
ncbi:uncharacterized protein LOC117322657 [Pecten maximus]|uniref:uncharacterized protein LOC117322657 n=1 Tax=Pecten maximus TaxID=6579 RepID=UPI0014585904|nr:uncharacterized protein LOC117322657 [Pecten maximus]